MTDTSREGLIEKMAQALYEREYDKDHYPWDNEEYKAPYLEDARAVLAVAEPAIREQCVRIALRKKKQKYYDSNSVGWEGEWEEVIEFPQEGEKIAAAIREGENDD